MRDPQDELFFPKKNAEIIQLERIGKTFIMRIANAGEPLQELGRTDAIEMPDEVLAGIFMCSHNPDVAEEGLAWNVRIEQTVPDSHNGYRDGVLGCKLETMNVFDGKRMIIHENSARFEAPNWMPDGKGSYLIRTGTFIPFPLKAALLNN